MRAQEDLNLRPLDPQSNALSTELWARIKNSERVGFEPTVPVRGQLLSREPDSAALAPLLFRITIITLIFYFVNLYRSERVGFEPTVPLAEDNGFQDRRFRPLSHLSFKILRYELTLKASITIF